MKVYWIHLPEQTDILREGYVGVTKQTIEDRRDQHGDRFPDECVMDVIIETDEEMALSIEKGLRPDYYIGWNIAPGGQAGNRPKGIHTSGWKQTEEANEKRRLASMNNTNGRYRAVETEVEGIKFRSVYEACDYLGKKYNIDSHTAYVRLLKDIPMVDGDARQNNGKNQKTRQCVLEGTTYAGQNEAARMLGWTVGKVRNRCLSKNYPDYYFID